MATHRECLGRKQAAVCNSWEECQTTNSPPVTIRVRVNTDCTITINYKIMWMVQVKIIVEIMITMSISFFKQDCMCPSKIFRRILPNSPHLSLDMLSHTVTKKKGEYEGNPWNSFTTYFQCLIPWASHHTWICWGFDPVYCLDRSFMLSNLDLLVTAKVPAIDCFICTCHENLEIR